MTSKPVPGIKITVDKNGRVRIKRVHKYDASAQRRIAKSKRVKVARKP